MKKALVTLAHGGGGTRTHALIRDIFLRYLGNPILEKLDDGACLEIPETRLVVTTDSYVVNPLFFPGGDIGKLAVCGTINDLAMQGAEPKYMSLGLILEEGLALEELERIIESAARVLDDTGVKVVTGDTKVVERGRGSGVYVNTTGIGVLYGNADVYVGNARPGDVVIVTGTLGDHGIAVLSRREGLKFESALESEVAPLWDMVKALLGAVPDVHCLRDPTRGGIAAALADIAETSGAGIRVKEGALPVKREVQGACGLLGLDPLNVANEGKAVVVCEEGDARQALGVLRAHPLGRESAIIGTVVEKHAGTVVLETRLGGERIVEKPSGEDLPRIC